MTENCCYNEEYKDAVDDCGGYYCSLRKIEWCEWFSEDACSECQYARDAGDEC